MVNKKAPTILSQMVVARSKLFTIQSLELCFSNGEQRTYERMKPTDRHSVMMVPISDSGDLLLVREYAAGTNRYELGFPKGLIDHNETAEQAANRELKEEIGFGCNTLIPLKQISSSPAYFSSHMTLFIARDLYPEKLDGDEPEPLELIRWPLQQAEELLNHADFNEARCISALLLALRALNLAKGY